MDFIPSRVGKLQEKIFLKVKILRRHLSPARGKIVTLFHLHVNWIWNLWNPFELGSSDSKDLGSDWTLITIHDLFSEVIHKRLSNYWDFEDKSHCVYRVQSTFDPPTVFFAPYIFSQFLLFSMFWEQILLFSDFRQSTLLDNLQLDILWKLAFRHFSFRHFAP